MFIDHAEIKVNSGKGGSGASSFRREKYVPKGGPDGGDGGHGGSVIIEASSNLMTLVDFHYQTLFRAKDGEKGMGANMRGRDADDLVIKVPCGTVVRDGATGAVMKDLIENGEHITVARGGRGGRGNSRFRSSTKQAPRFYEKGEPGEERTIVLELKILADAGLIGMANAGKSTLLSKISNARPKIANYPFTTLTPVLGIVKMGESSFVAADIPGLIEGASEGKGLGIEFLKHIERTKVFIHVVDPTQGSAIDNYKMIRKELKAYSKKLMSKPEIIVVNKSDLLSDDEKKRIKADFSKKKLKFDFIVAREGIGVENTARKVYNILKEIPREIIKEKADFKPETDVPELEVIEKGVYRLISKAAERKVAMLDFEKFETIDAFGKYLKASGLNEFMKNEGVQTGDIVVIGDRDFVYEDEE